MGYLYKRKKQGKELATWWMKYYVNGVPIRESTGTDKETVARRLMKEREGRVDAGQPKLPGAGEVRYEEIAQDLRQHYATTGSRDLVEAEKRLKHLDRFFTGRRIVSIGGADAAQYVAARQREGVVNGTINRELSMLTKMLRLSYE